MGWPPPAAAEGDWRLVCALDPADGDRSWRRASRVLLDGQVVTVDEGGEVICRDHCGAWLDLREWREHRRDSLRVVLPDLDAEAAG